MSPEKLQIRVKQSLSGTNNHNSRRVCKTPEEFYNYWRKRQIEAGNYETVAYADTHKSTTMSVIIDLYSRYPKYTERKSKPKKAPRGRTNQLPLPGSHEEYRLVYELLERHATDKPFNDFINNIVFPRTSRFDKWRSSK